MGGVGVGVGRMGGMATWTTLRPSHGGGPSPGAQVCGGVGRRDGWIVRVCAGWTARLGTNRQEHTRDPRPCPARRASPAGGRPPTRREGAGNVLAADATIIEQARGSKRRGCGDGTSTRDQEASFTKKDGETYYGSKGPIAADRSGIVKDSRFSDAALHDSNFIDELMQDEKKMVVADSAYRSHERGAALQARGVCCAIPFKRPRGQKDLPSMLKKHNRLNARVRAVVEHPFAWMRAMGYRRVCYRGRLRDEVNFALNRIAYNWKRSLSLAWTT